MASVETAPGETRAAAVAWTTIGMAALAAAALVLMAERAWLALHCPLWLDETWTAAIVSPPRWGDFQHEVWLDVNAPLYYLLMRGWTAVFGLSDFALRAPGLILAPLAALLAWRSPGADLSEVQRRLWAVLLFFWWGCGQFLDGRCYALLLLINVGQAIAFVRLLKAPTLKAAAAWCLLAALSILCHYYALFIVAAQGLVFLAAHRQRALRVWPALLAFAPTLAWMAHHARRLAHYGRPDVAWHPPLSLGDAIGVMGFTVGAYSLLLALTALAILAAFALLGRSSRAPRSHGDREAWLAAGAGLLALALLLLVSAVKPSLTPRYAIPIVPSILLGIAIRTSVLQRTHSLAAAALIAAYALFAIEPGHFSTVLRQGAPYGFEAGESYLRSRNVDEVTYLWDHPVAKIIAPGSLKRIGAAYFEQVGDPVAINPIVVAPGLDPNRLLIAAAGGARPGVLWIYDRSGHTAAREHPPHIDRVYPAWDCRTFGDGETGSVACVKLGGAVR